MLGYSKQALILSTSWMDEKCFYSIGQRGVFLGLEEMESGQNRKGRGSGELDLGGGILNPIPTWTT